MENKDLGKTSTGIEANVAGLLCYLLGWVTGLIFFLIEKDNKFVRFHALQSMIIFGAVTVFNFIFTETFMMFNIYYDLVIVIKLVWLAAVALWVVLMVKAYQGEMFKVPVAGDIAEKNK